MKKIIWLFLFSVFAINLSAQHNTIYNFKSTTIDGRPFDFASLKGKKILVVNTASKCGFTPQYADLEKLYEKYKNHNLVIVGFPANNFKEQEPGTNREIQEFCTRNYGVTFPMMQKISVVGQDMDPIYKWLTQKSENGVMDAPVKWNFQKFMIDENGKLAGVAASAEKPDSEKIIRWIEN
jgi:glutathione peroxidase